MIGETVSHYKILEHIGGGSMGIVYRARDTRLNRDVALKFLPPAFTKDSEAKQRFIHEAQAASSLDHPNIYTIHEIDETNDGRLFICMTRYQGSSLKEILDENALSVNEVIDIAVQVARGLSKAHKNGIIHQDIKPANILLTEDGIAKIVDFGIARMTGEHISQVGTIVGTAAYMSPEQASGEMVDERTDIWSLGVVLYEMLAGTLPFSGQYEQAIIYAIINEQPQKITELRPEVPAALERIILKSLRKNPLERYQDIDELLNDLQQLTAGSYAAGFGRKFTGGQKQVNLTILPFFNLSGDKSEDYFCEGFAEDLQRTLSEIDNIHISSFRESVKLRETYEDIREIAKHLTSHLILEGAVRKEENRVRITAQLINVEDGINIWAERYETPADNILELQSEIIENLLEELEVTPSEAEKSRRAQLETYDPKAFESYLRGLQAFRKFSKRSLLDARKLFQSAVEQDDNFLRARELLLITYIQQYLVFEDMYPERLLEDIQHLIDERSEESPLLRQSALFIQTVNHQVTKTELQNLSEIAEQNPENKYVQLFYALALFSSGYIDKSMQVIKQTAENDTEDYFFSLMSGMLAYFSKNFTYAKATISHAINLDPSVSLGHIWLGYTFLELQHESDAQKQFELAVKYSGDSAFSRIAQGFYHARVGASEKTAALLQEIRQEEQTAYVSYYYIARIYAEMGHQQEALQALRKSVQCNEPGVIFLFVDPVFKQIMSQSEFKKLQSNIPA